MSPPLRIAPVGGEDARKHETRPLSSSDVLPICQHALVYPWAFTPRGGEGLHLYLELPTFPKTCSHRCFTFHYWCGGVMFKFRGTAVSRMPINLRTCLSPKSASEVSTI